MKKKAIKIAAASAVAASAFVANAPLHSQAATNVGTVVDNAVKQMQKAYHTYGDVTAKGKFADLTAVYKEYNAAKTAYANAKSVVTKAGGKQKDAYLAKLDSNYNELIAKRVITYIDAYNYGKALAGYTADFNAAVSSSNWDAAEEVFNQISYQLKSRGVIIDRVYGVSTRTLLKTAFRAPAELVVKNNGNQVTAKVAIEAAQEAVAAGELTAAGTLLAKADAALKAADQNSDFTKALLVKYAAVNSAYLYPQVKQAAENTVVAYETLANGDLSTQALVDAAKVARTAVKVDGLNSADTQSLLARVTAADVKVDAAQKAIDAAVKTYQELLEKATGTVKAYEDLANGDLSTQALVDAAKAAKAVVHLDGLKDADKTALDARVAAADAKVTAAETKLATVTVDSISALTATEATVVLKEVHASSEDATKYTVKVGDKVVKVTAVTKVATDLTGKTFKLTLETLVDTKGKLSINGVEKDFDFVRPLGESVKSLNTTSVELTLPADSTLTNTDLVGKKLVLKSGDVSVEATYLGSSLNAGKATFQLESGKTLVDATTYKVDGDFKVKTDSFVAKVAAAYAQSFSQVTNAVRVATTGDSQTLVFGAKNQYGEKFSVTDASKLKATVTFKGMPLTGAEVSGLQVNGDGTIQFIVTGVAIAEGDQLSVKLENFSATNTVLGTSTFAYTAVKGAAPVATTILTLAADKTEVVYNDSVTLSADVRDQYNNKIAGNLRWVVTSGKELIQGGNLFAGTYDGNNTATLTGLKPGTITVDVYNTANQTKSTITITVGAAKLASLFSATENPGTRFNQEDIAEAVITGTAGAILTPDMLKANVTALTQGTVAGDATVTFAYRGGTAANAKDIVMTVKTAKAGNFTITPYVGTQFDANAIKLGAPISVTTTLNPGVVSFDALTVPTVKKGAPVTVDFVARNSHNEAVAVQANQLTVDVFKGLSASTKVAVAKLDKDGNVLADSSTTAVAKLKFTFDAAATTTDVGAYTVRVTKTGTALVQNVGVTTEIPVLKTIDLGIDIVDNTIVSGDTTAVLRPVSLKDSKTENYTAALNELTLTATDSQNNPVAGFATLVFYKYDTAGNVVLANSAAEAKGIAVSYAPSSVDTSVDKVVTVNIVSATDATVKDTLSATVKAKRVVKSIAIADSNVALVPGASAKREVTVLDQYGKAVTDTAKLDVVIDEADGKDYVDAALSYDATAKKMYLTYTAKAVLGSETVTVQSVADNTIKAVSSFTNQANTAITSVKFDARNYKVLNSATDSQDQTVTLTYKVNGGAFTLPSDQLTFVYDTTKLDVVKVGNSISVKAKAGVQIATANTDEKQTITVLTPTGLTDTIELTFSNVASSVNLSTVKFADSVDEDAVTAGTQVIIGKDKDGVVNTETTSVLTLEGIDQYGVTQDVTGLTTWVIANEGVATMNNGVVTKVAAGSTTATGFYKGQLFTATIIVPAAQ